jgi:hypothetical protein
MGGLSSSPIDTSADSGQSNFVDVTTVKNNFTVTDEAVELTYRDKGTDSHLLQLSIEAGPEGAGGHFDNVIYCAEIKPGETFTKIPGVTIQGS